MAATAALVTVTAQAGAEASRNMLHGDAATFSATPGGWTSTDAVLSVDKGAYHSGPGSLLAKPQIGSTAMDLASPPLAAIPGHVYSGRVWTTSSTLSAGVAVGLQFITGTGTVTHTTYGSVQQAGSKWLQMPVSTAIAPAHAKSVQLTVRVPSAQLATAVHVDDAVLVDNGAPARPSVRGIHVRGTRIVGSDGQPVTLRGLERVGLDTDPTNQLTAADARAFRRWGVNVVRLPLSPSFWLRSGCAYDPNYRSRVADVVRMLTRRHIVTMIQLHTTKPCSSSGKPPMPDETQAIPFWRQVAHRFRGNRLVMFDLYNEPHDVTQHVWLHGGPVSWEYDYRAAGMQQMYDDVRAAGARNVVVVVGMGWGSVPPTRFVRGRNIAYAPHAYTCPSKPPPQCSYGGNVWDARPILRRWLDVARHHAIIVNEFGWPKTSDSGRFLESVIRFSNHHGWGWVAYGFDGSVGDNFDLIGAKLSGATYEPTPVAMPVLHDLAHPR